MRILLDDLSGPEIARFLADHLRQMLSTTPPESVHALDLGRLRGPDITFWSVWDGDELVGCGALKRLDERHGEVKSMRTAPARQRGGVASLLLAHIIEQAWSMGCDRLSLETGSGDVRPARRLYEKFGFNYGGPFADYCLDPSSVFMTRAV